MSNLFTDIPPAGPEEFFETLIEADGLRVERIVSHGQASPPDFWYDQPQHEWVLVLKGQARLRFDNGEEIALNPGDAINIPAHRRHRVAWTTPDEPTLWLAIHYG